MHIMRFVEYLNGQPVRAYKYPFQDYNSWQQEKKGSNYDTYIKGELYPILEQYIEDKQQQL